MACQAEFLVEWTQLKLAKSALLQNEKTVGWAEEKGGAEKVPVLSKKKSISLQQTTYHLNVHTTAVLTHE